MNRSPRDLNRPGGRHSPGLRSGFFNPAGFRISATMAPDENSGRRRRGAATALNILRLCWRHLKLDIIGCGEIWIKIKEDQITFQQQLDDAAQEFGFPRYVVIWGCCRGPETRSGVAVLVRASLLESGALTITEDSVVSSPDGRLLHFPCSWGGHEFRLIVVYLPSGESALQREFVDSRLHPLMSASDLPVMLLGDFNFTDNWRLDRQSVVRADGVVNPGSDHPIAPFDDRDQPNQRRSHRDNQPAARMIQLCSEHSLVDTFRAKHPSTRGYTFFCHNAASRLDRIYMSQCLFQHIDQADKATHSCSDHVPVYVHLRPLLPSSFGRMTPKARCEFWASEPLQNNFIQWLKGRVAGAPTDSDQLLIAWWPGFKRDIVVKTITLNKAHRQNLQRPTEDQAAAEDCLREALGAVEKYGSPAALTAALDARRRFVAASAASITEEELRSRRKWLKLGEHPNPDLTMKLTRSPLSRRCIAALKCAGGGMVTDGPSMSEMVAQFWSQISSSPPVSPEVTAAQEQVLAAIHQHVAPLTPELASKAGSPVISRATVIKFTREIPADHAPGPDGISHEVWRRCIPEIAGLLATLYTAIGRTGTVPAGFLDGLIKSLLKPSTPPAPPTDPAELGNYRPITLLNTDYRLLGKILASRLGSALSSRIDSAQSAFLPGRRMADNILLLQLLPSLLRLNVGQVGGAATKGVVAFLDFKKAYDTVDRSFLLRVMEATGAGGGFVDWIRTLLTNTNAAASVNGHVSSLMSFTAGIRQGGGESPLVYLFVAWALSCWLRNCPAVGIKVTPDCTLRGAQYADDATPILCSLDPADVGQFIEAMRVFGLAFNQHLNLGKTKLLPVGDWSAENPLPSEVCGLKVIAEAKSLGITFSNAPEGPGVDWEEAVGRVKRAYSKIAKLHLSTFGRAMAGATYGTSQLLHLLEHSGPPPPTVATELAALHRRLVDLGRPPILPGAQTHPGDHMPGMRSQMLVGRAVDGGFGALPWEEHTLARWLMQIRRYCAWEAGDPALLAPKSVWQLRRRQQQAAQGGAAFCPTVEEELLLAEVCPVRPLWIDLLSAILRRVCPYTHPVLTLLSASHANPDEMMARRLPVQRFSPSLPPLPSGPLTQWTAALKAMGPPDCNNPPVLSALLAGRAPLFGNPYLQFELEASRRTVAWPASMQGLALGPFALMLTARGGMTGNLWDLLAHFHMIDRPFEAMATYTLTQCCPASWRIRPAPQATQELASTLANKAVAAIVGTLGWRQLPSVTRPSPSPPLLRLLGNTMSVRAATRILIAPRLKLQCEYRKEYVESALNVAAEGGVTPTSIVDATRELGELPKRMQRVWKVRECPNAYKDTLWRMVLNGIRAGGGHDACINRPCSCGWQPPPPLGRIPPLPPRRLRSPEVLETALAARAAHEKRIRERAYARRRHVFWDCPVAQAVISHIKTGLPGNVASSLSCADIWLLRVPAVAAATGALHADVWAMVCTIALHAMEKGRALLYALSNDSRPAPDPHPTATSTTRAANRAVEWFRFFLQNVASLGDIPKDWKNVTAGHPFLCSIQAPDGNSSGTQMHSCRLALNLPAGPNAVVLPDTLD